MTQTVSGTFTAAGVSATLKVYRTPQDITFSVSGTFTGQVWLERALSTEGTAWEVVRGPWAAATGTLSYHAEPMERLRFRSTVASGSADYSMADGDAVFAEVRSPQNVRTGARTEGGDYIVGDLIVDGTLTVGGVAWSGSLLAKVVSTSTSAVAIGTGSKTLVSAVSMDVTLGSWIVAADHAAPTTNYMIGQVTAKSGTTITFTVPTGGAVGSGTPSAYDIGIVGPMGATGAMPTSTTTSTTSLTIGAGSFTFTTATSLDTIVGQFLTLASAANVANYMTGQVTAKSGTSVTISVGANDYGGSGTKTDWNVSLSGAKGTKGDTGATGPAGAGNVATVVGTANEISVNSADPANPVVSIPSAVTLTGKTLTGGTHSGATISGGTIDNAPIGGTTKAAGGFTTLTATGAVTLSPANANVVASPTGSGTVTINPATAGTIDNVAVGGTTKAAGGFTTLAATSVVSVADGSAGAPEVTFTADTDTGFYRIGANNVGWATGGLLNVDILGVASAVNNLRIKNAATGGGPELLAVGSDTDIPLKLTPKGAGYVHVTATGLKFPDNTTQTTAASSGISAATVWGMVASMAP